MPIDSDLTYFDFDQDSAILKNLTGKVKNQYQEWFRNATGSSNIRISSKVGPDKLTDLCGELFKLYKSTDYLSVPDFKGLQNIAPTTDPIVIDKLDNILIEQLRKKSTDVQLCIPSMVDYRSDELWVTFTGAGSGEVYEDLAIENYYHYLETKKVIQESINTNMLKQHRLALTNGDGVEKGERFSVFKSLIFETQQTNPAGTFYLCEGKWYRVDANFVQELTTYLNPFFKESELPHFDHANEGDYNEKIAENLGCACLDETNIAPSGQTKVEPCDILELKNNEAILHHIKIATKSGLLSHLFNQGTNSIHLLRDEKASLDAFKQLIGKKAPEKNQTDLTTAVTNGKMLVSFGIITTKDPAKKSANLPLFSRMSLRRALKDLQRLQVTTNVCYISDNSSPKAGTKKKRKAKTAAKRATMKNATTKKAAKKSVS